jgi:hypothetical protein
MAYTTRSHRLFSQRVENWMKTFQSLRDELERMDEIFVNEANEGADPEFVTTPNGTKQEHIDALTMMRDLRLFIENGAPDSADRTQVITAFTQET